MSFQLSPDVVYRKIGGETVLADLRANRVYALNATGSRFWELLARGHDRRRIERTLRSEYEVEAPRLRREIDLLLRRLTEARLVTEQGDD